MPKQVRKSRSKKKVRATKSAARKTRPASRRTERSKVEVSRSRPRQPLDKTSAFRLDDGEPRVEKTEAEELIPGAAADDLAEEMGEEFVEEATSGEAVAEDVRDEVVPEEEGGPFVETDGRTEFASGTDASNPEDAEPAALPTVSRLRRGVKPQV